MSLFVVGKLGFGKPDGDSSGGMHISGFPGGGDNDPLSGGSYSPNQADSEAPAPADHLPSRLKLPGDKEEFYSIVDLLVESKRLGASDLHLTVGAPPTLRIDGELVPMNFPSASSDEIKGVIYSMMNEMQIKEFEIEREYDFAYSLKNFGRQ